MTTWRREDGSVAVETAIVAPVLLALMLLVVYAGRAAQADADVRSAVARAARAASIAGDAAAAVDVATSTAFANLDTAGVLCQDRSVDVDTGVFHAGGSVRVSVACLVSNRDLALLAVPGARWSTATATQVVDTYRGGD